MLIYHSDFVSEQQLLDRDSLTQSTPCRPDFTPQGRLEAHINEVEKMMDQFLVKVVKWHD